MPQQQQPTFQRKISQGLIQRKHSEIHLDLKSVIGAHTLLKKLLGLILKNRK